MFVGHTLGMEETFAIVLFAVVAIAAVVAVWALATSGGAYREIGRGGIAPAKERPGDREAEIRQLLQARNARRAARGEPAADVEAELRALTDPELREEVRALVRARNARRAARGEPPLDVEAEVDRRLGDLGAG
jgi:hypothetical protein